MVGAKMTTMISSKGQLVIPRQVRERQEIRPGDDFLLFELANGDILLRRAYPPKRSLVWHLRRLRGLELKRHWEPVREAAATSRAIEQPSKYRVASAGIRSGRLWKNGAGSLRPGTTQRNSVSR